MYKFSYYTEQDKEKVIAFMKANPFAIITGAGETYPVATQVPLEIKIGDDKILLQGHIMRKTDHHLAFEKNNNVLVLFTGPHCFVSASWYTDPAVGSTWNYMTVHAKGKMRFMDLLREVDGIAAKMLSKELHDLESHQLVKRTVMDTKPITVEYEITPYGRSLERVLIEISDWGLGHRRHIMKGE